MIGKIRDTILGLWPVLKTYVPTRGLVIGVVVAFIVGLIWGYALDPVKFYDADPTTLGQGWQDEFVRLIADRYTLNTQNAEPSDEFKQGVINDLKAVDNPVEIVQRLGLTQITDLAQQAQVFAPAEAPGAPNIIASIRPFIVGAIVVAVGLVIGSLLYGFYFSPLVVEPIRKRIRGAQGTDAAGAGKIHDIQAARVLRDQLAKDAAAAPVSDLGPPVVRHVSIYTPGRAFDDSFSIEDATKDDEFLGECGATISETIGVGDPEKVTAVEIWLFDKEDFVRTLTSVFVSEHAYNDPAIRSKLEPKGELVIAKPGAIITLETSALRLTARIVDVVYGTGPLPPNSYFDKMTIEIQAWRNSGASIPVAAPMAVPAAAVPTYTAPPTPAPQPSFTPPPTMPTYTPPPAVASPFASPTTPSAPPSFGGGTPFKPATPPPPAAPTRPIADDDPFGGTGDFTPVN
ncbi:MAG: hypothetical protein ABI690_32020 [Chloroflexota bacterium]